MQRARNSMVGLVLLIAITLVAEVSCMASEVERELAGKTAADVFADPGVAQLARAGCEGRADDVQQLAQSGVVVDTRGLDDMTPLVWTEHCRNTAGAIALLDAGANPNGVTPSLHPVFVAVDIGDSEMLRILLDRGGSPNATLPMTAWTALRLALSTALENGEWTSYEMLLESGADINRRYGGDTIAEFAAALNAWDKVADLIERGYSRDLIRIGGFAQNADPAIMSPEQASWRDNVRTSLEERGVRFPVSSEAMATPPDD